MRDRTITIRDMGAFPVHHPRTAAGAVTAAVLLAALAAPATAGADPADDGEFQVRVGVEGSSLRVGQTADYTVKAVNTGPADYPDAAVVQLLPPDLDRPEAADGGRVEPLQIVWERPLESGGEAVVGSSGRVGSPSEGFDKLTTVACVRPSPGAGLVGCTSSAVPIAASLTPLWAGGAVLVLAAAGAWYLVRRRPEALARARATAVQFTRSAGAAVGIRRVAARQPAAGEAGTTAGAADSAAPTEAPAEVEEMLDLELMPWRYRFNHLHAPAAAVEAEAGAEDAAEEAAVDAADADLSAADSRESADEAVGAGSAAQVEETEVAEQVAANAGSADEPAPAEAAQDSGAAADEQDAADAAQRDAEEEPEPASAEQDSAAVAEAGAEADPEAAPAAESASATDTDESAEDDGDDADSDPATTPADRALAAADRD